MQELLDKIKAKKDKIKTLLKTDNNKNEYAKWLKYELAYTSNAIEGNTLTRKETVRIIEDRITSSSKPFVYYQEAINHAKAYIYMLELIKNKQNINENELFQIHKLILSGIDDSNAGIYRNCRVSISGSRVILPNPLKVPSLMTEFFEWLNNADKKNPLTAIEAHYRLVKIHPFVDGNGRVARLLMNYILMKENYCPIIIRLIDRKRYIDNIEKYQLYDDGNAYTKFMLSALNRSLKTCINLLDTDKEDTDKSELLSISRFAQYVNLPTSTIRYWVKTKKIKPIMYTVSGYMQFAKHQREEVKEILNPSKTD